MNHCRLTLPWACPKAFNMHRLLFIIVANHLEKWDLTYKTEAEERGRHILINGESSSESKFDVFIDKFMRHIA